MQCSSICQAKSLKDAVFILDKLFSGRKSRKGYKIIKKYMPDDQNCKELYSYFERQWLKKTSPRLWNHFESNVRTNNRIEGFHSGLNKMISSQHPNIFILINHLKVQQASINQFIQYPCEYWYDSPDQVDQFFNDNSFENTQGALHENLELRTESVEQCFETFVNEVHLVQDNVTFADLQTDTELPSFFHL
ncbi:unnamed protein product [Brachionus calyciflorus]|uniref:Uncharacterized protein n=1 Tax=Brachionus calyciflorus TaxID=104777 RepID=A0A814NYZ4_9BILA|nr:unnamed protein product [Brachionus calyciflorus]